MSLHHKTFDFYGKMINNKNFYIFNTNSQEEKEEIKSKIEKFDTIPEFFSYYTNLDIKHIFDLIDKLDSIYSNLYDENNSSNFKSKIDIYISNLSNIYLLSNLILKNRLILNKAISKTKTYLNDFYSKNNMDKNKQKKINDYVLNLLGTINKKNKNRNPIIIYDENTFNKNNSLKIDNFNISNFEPKNNNINTENKIFENSVNNSSLNQEITHDITNNTYNNNSNINFVDNQNIIIDFTTPQFPNKIIEDTLINEINRSMFKKGTIQSSVFDNNEEINKNFVKKESIHSLYTLASKSKNKTSSKFINIDDKNKVSSKFLIQDGKNKISSKFINQEEKIKLESSKYKDLIIEEKNNPKNINSFLNNNDINNMNDADIKRNSSVKINNFTNNIYQLTENKINNINRKNIEEDIHRNSRKKTFSTTNLKSSDEKHMLKNCLIYVNDIYRKEIINSEEKLKLKQLIISRSEKLGSIYHIYKEDNKDKFIQELKKLIK